MALLVSQSLHVRKHLISISCQRSLYEHPYFIRQSSSAFDRLIPQGEQVPYFLYFDVPAENIDVNIHPTKTEIKFENEQAIWQILLAAVKEAVGRFNDIPAIDFDTEGKPDIPVFKSQCRNVRTKGRLQSCL